MNKRHCEQTIVKQQSEFVLHVFREKRITKQVRMSEELLMHLRSRAQMEGVTLSRLLDTIITLWLGRRVITVRHVCRRCKFRDEVVVGGEGVTGVDAKHLL
jgi:predicted DNA binding CopG/RHH family protein